MTPPKPPTDIQPGPSRAPAPGRDPGADVLSDLPPLPRTKPATKAPQEPSGGPEQGAQPDNARAKAKGEVDGRPAVNKKDLFARVKARTGKVKGSDVRQVMDAVLDEIGEALVAGEALKLPALGTMKVQRHKSRPKADVVVCKLNRKKRGQGAKDPLAKPPKDG